MEMKEMDSHIEDDWERKKKEADEYVAFSIRLTDV